jgi:hypothetical protein
MNPLDLLLLLLMLTVEALKFMLRELAALARVDDQ